MAGFQLSINGRFWVSTEGRHRLAFLRLAAMQTVIWLISADLATFWPQAECLSNLGATESRPILRSARPMQRRISF
jgi:hypothetical protein